MTRKLTFEQAKAKFVHRYTMEHVPQWAHAPKDKDMPGYYAPQFRTDREWYDNTKFHGEDGFFGVTKHDCFTTGQTWPLGKWLKAPYSR